MNASDNSVSNNKADLDDFMDNIGIPNNKTAGNNHSVESPIKFQEPTTDCPYCGEEILEVAKKCKHCGEFVSGSHALISDNYSYRPATIKVSEEQMKKEKSSRTTAIVGFIIGILAVNFIYPIGIAWLCGEEGDMDEVSDWCLIAYITDSEAVNTPFFEQL